MVAEGLRKNAVWASEWRVNGMQIARMEEVASSISVFVPWMPSICGHLAIQRSLASLQCVLCASFPVRNQRLQRYVLRHAGAPAPASKHAEVLHVQTVRMFRRHDLFYIGPSRLCSTRRTVLKAPAPRKLIDFKSDNVTSVQPWLFAACGVRLESPTMKNNQKLPLQRTHLNYSTN